MHATLTESDEIQEYVLGIQNPAQLISSLALMLRERNYVCLYDTSILSSPEPHLKKTNMEELNKDFLYKWFLFFNGLARHFTSYANLIIIPQVAEEMSNLVNATLSAIEKRKNQFQSYSPQQKIFVQGIYEQLCKNEEILTEMHSKLDTYRQSSPSIIKSVFDHLLELIKLLDLHLELKKPSVQKNNDTDERLVARAFYEVALNNYNVAVYTRDDDVRKLISATFKFLISQSIAEETNLSFCKRFTHQNILVFKYNYEKKVFSRFFESSTLPSIVEFRFPNRLTKNKVNQIIDQAKEILHKIQNIVDQEVKSQDTSPQPILEEKDKEKDILKSVEGIFHALGNLKVLDDLPNHSFKISLLENLATLTYSLKYEELYALVMEQKDKAEKLYIEKIIVQLKEEKEKLQKRFDELCGATQTQKIEYWQQIQSMQQIQTVAESIQENLRKLRFFENALDIQRYGITYKDYERFRELLEEFHRSGFNIDEKETPVPKEKIAQIAKLSSSETIKIIEANKIKYETSHVYLTQANLMLFIQP